MNTPRCSVIPLYVLNTQDLQCVCVCVCVFITVNKKSFLLKLLPRQNLVVMASGLLCNCDDHELRQHIRFGEHLRFGSTAGAKGLL